MVKKSYAGFKKEFLDRLSAELAAEGIYTRETVVKKTNGERDGIVLKIPGHNASPIVYPSVLHESYLNGHTVSELVTVVKEQAEQVRSLPEKLSYDSRYLAKHIYPVMINAERNQELLRQLPYERYHDLAIVPRCKVDGMDGASFYVTKNYLKSLHMSPSECMDLAMDSLDRQGYTATPMNDIIGNLTNDTNFSGTLKDTAVAQLYVLTNIDGAYGASAMLDRMLLADLSKKMDTERIFVIPSSVHEVICAPVPRNADAMTVREMESMVYTINRTEVLPADFLSDSVYIFDRQKMAMEIATEKNIFPGLIKETSTMTMRM